MPYSLYWHVPKRVLYQCVVGDTSLEEYQALNRETLAALADGIAPVHCIADVLGVGKYPHDPEAVQRVLNTDTQGRLGWYVLVSDSPLVRFLAMLVVHASHPFLHTTASVAAAKTFLQARDSSLVFPASSGDETRKS